MLIQGAGTEHVIEGSEESADEAVTLSTTGGSLSLKEKLRLTVSKGDS